MGQGEGSLGQKNNGALIHAFYVSLDRLDWLLRRQEGTRGTLFGIHGPQVLVKLSLKCMIYHHIKERHLKYQVVEVYGQMWKTKQY